MIFLSFQVGICADETTIYSCLNRKSGMADKANVDLQSVFDLGEEMACIFYYLQNEIALI